MNVESIMALYDGVDTTSIRPQGAVNTSFSNWLENEIGEVSSQITAAEEAAQSLASGDAENLHQVMIALDKAQLSMNMVVEVRNRLLEGYQEVMRMSI